MVQNNLVQWDPISKIQWNLIIYSFEDESAMDLSMDLQGNFETEIITMNTQDPTINLGGIFQHTVTDDLGIVSQMVEAVFFVFGWLFVGFYSTFSLLQLSSFDEKTSGSSCNSK